MPDIYFTLQITETYRYEATDDELAGLRDGSIKPENIADYDQGNGESVEIHSEEIVNVDLGDGPRYWVNDLGGPAVTATITHNGTSIATDTFVGLVDEQAGGVIAYGDLEHMHALAKQLNQA